MTEMFLQSLNNEGFNVTIVEKTFSKRIEDVRKFSILKILKIPKITIRLILNLVKNEFDLCFYFLSIKPPSIFVDTFFIFIIRMFRINYIQYLHAKGLVQFDEILVQPFRYLVKNTISNSLGGIVLGERLKMDVNHLIPDRNIFVLPNAVPDINHKKIFRDYNNEGIVKILFLSHLMPLKGPMEFLKMVKKINRLHKNVHFYLAGPKMSDHFFSEINEFIRNENLKDLITVTGPVYGEKKEILFMENDIFVFPTHDEAFGLVILEAMRAGLPVVTSPEGSIPEIVNDGINGFIVDPKNIDMLTNRVLKLIIDPKLRIKMGNAGRGIYEKRFTTNSYRKRLKQGVKFFLELKDKSCKQ